MALNLLGNDRSCREWYTGSIVQSNAQEKQAYSVFKEVSYERMQNESHYKIRRKQNKRKTSLSLWYKNRECLNLGPYTSSLTEILGSCQIWLWWASTYGLMKSSRLHSLLQCVYFCLTEFRNQHKLFDSPFREVLEKRKFFFLIYWLSEVWEII